MTVELEPTPAEQKLIDAAARGEIADYRVGDEEADDPANGANWGDERTLRAEIIYALCVGTEPEWKAHAKGVWVWGARIVDNLDFDAATLHVPLGLIYCHIDERITLRDARTRSLAFQGSHCKGISADRLAVEGSVFLRDGFHAKGEVRLVNADIGGNLDCVGARFENPEGYALNAAGLVNKGYVYLRDGFSATGKVMLLGADIGGNLECVGARFENPKGKALIADLLVTNGNVILGEGFHAKGEVRLVNADIGGNLECNGARFENPDGIALIAENMRVSGALLCHDLVKQPEGSVNFGHARVEQLFDDEGSWPGPGNLVLDGFVYGAIAGSAPRTAAERLRWLQLQPNEPVVRRQPYEQLVRVLRQMGYEQDASEIAIAKQEAIRKSDESGWLRSFWMGFLGITIGYGHKPWRALLFMAFFMVFGAVVFDDAHRHKIMVPSQVQVSDPTPYQMCAKSYPCLQPFVYSVDTFLPIVDLHQEKYWRPDENTIDGRLHRVYLWLHIMFGWLLSTVLVAGLTGLVKKD